MKKILTILFLLSSLISIGQTVQVNQKDSTVFKPSTKAGATVYVIGPIKADTLRLSNRDTTAWHPRDEGTLNYFNGSVYVWNDVKWVAASSGSGGGGSDTLAGGVFTTSNVQVGFNPGTNISSAQLLNKVFYGLQPPTATLTGGATLELTSASTVAKTLIWSAGRQLNTPPLTSIVVAGISQTFVQPAINSTVSSFQNVNVPANATTVYNNVVTASDGQTATASTTFNSAPRRFFGFISDTTGIRTGSQDAAIRALTSNLSTAKALTANTGSPGGSQFYVYAYLASLGAITSITFNGIPATDAMTTITKTFITANGYTDTYYIIFNKQAQTTSSDVIFQ